MKKKKQVAIKKQIKSVSIIKTKSDKIIPALIKDTESKLVLEEVQGKIIDKLAYSYENKGTKVEGLTFWGLLACAEECKKGKWSPEWTKPEYLILPDSSTVLTIGCKNPKTKHTEWGNCVFYPKARFSERVAMTNAKRYALDKHISIPQKISFIHYLKQHKPNMILEKSNTEEFTTPKTSFVISDSGKIKMQTVKEKEEVL